MPDSISYGQWSSVCAGTESLMGTKIGAEKYLGLGAGMLLQWKGSEKQCGQKSN